MKSRKHKISFLNKLKDEIKNAETAMLTTVSLQGKLRSRPVLPLEMDESGTLWFFTNEFYERTNEVIKNPLVCISYSNSKNQNYVSITGEADIVTNNKKMKELWNPLLQKWFPEGLEDSQLVLLSICIDEVEYWDSQANKMVRVVPEVTETFTVKKSNEEYQQKKILFSGFKRSFIRFVVGN